MTINFTKISLKKINHEIFEFKIFQVEINIRE